MKRVPILFFCVAIIFSCKKEKQITADPEPEPVKTGTVNINVTTYDSLGDVESDFSGVRVSLYKTSFSATTAANGSISFNNVPYGDLLPVLTKPGYDGPPLSVNLNSNAITANLPCAKYSAYKIINLTGQAVNKDSITIAIKLDRPVPAGKVCKIAVIYSVIAGWPGSFVKADSISITSQNVQKINIANLPNFKAALALLNKDDTFYINAVPVSYGIFQSNLLGTQVLMGDNIYPPTSLNFKKNW